MTQHLTAIKVAQLLSSAEMVGDYRGSTELCFSPHGLRGGDIFYDIGTARATSLVIQTLIPSVIFVAEKAG
jgi:RNA 3'-terminal phosphate cyclase (ATP)